MDLLIVACTGLGSLLTSLIPDRAFFRVSIKMRLVTTLALVFAFAGSTVALPITPNIAACLGSAQALAVDMGEEAIDIGQTHLAYFYAASVQLVANVVARNTQGIATIAEYVVAESNPAPSPFRTDL